MLLMNSLKIRQPISINSIIEAIRLGHDFNDNLCLYTAEEVGKITAELICYLDDYPEVFNDKDQYSDFVNEHDLYLLYYGEQFKDVMQSVLTQQPQASVGEFTKALNYYMENDDFLDYSN